MKPSGTGSPRPGKFLKRHLTGTRNTAKHRRKGNFLHLLALTVGSHSITADYSGSTDYKASTSPVLTETVNQETTTTTVTSSLNPSIFGERVILTATVKPSGTGSPTGARSSSLTV